MYLVSSYEFISTSFMCCFTGVLQPPAVHAGLSVVIPLVLYSSGKPCKTQKAARASGAPVWPDIVPLCPLFLLLCVFSVQHSEPLVSPTLPRSTESRPRFHWPVSTFPLSPTPSGGICAQRARSQLRTASDNPQPITAGVSFT